MITTKEYISLLQEISKNQQIYTSIFKFGETEFDILDTIRRTHNRIRKIYEDRRMNPNWDRDYMAEVAGPVTERLNLELYELQEYCSYIDITPTVHEHADYKQDQRKLVTYMMGNRNITKIIDL